MKKSRPFPQVTISKKAARSLAGGHPWVFADEVRSIEPAPSDGRELENGDVVDLREENGTYQGTGLYSAQSKIRVRVVSRNANDRFDGPFWARKVRWAWEYRKRVMGQRALPGCEEDTRCCRVVFSEADGFPGLIVDRYEDVLVSQVGTVGMERLRDTIYPELIRTVGGDDTPIRGIYERNDIKSRAKEGLPSYAGWWTGEGAPADPGTPRVIAHENGIAYDLDLVHSQKTGFFLDQKYNRRAVRDLSRGARVLDCFSHVGPFGLNAAAGGASFVRCVDISQTACDLARANAELNGFQGRMDFTAADVFAYLDGLLASKAALREAGGPFDLIVLDPPAFTKSRHTRSAAARGYREINNQALRLLPRGGYLATCSCSHFMDAAHLKAAIAQAAHDASIQLRQVEERQQAPDHPILWGVPETHYLDFLIFQVV